MISIRKVSLGGGYRYLIESVATGDGAAARSSPLTRYYAESGTPPGVFLGAGLVELDGGRGVRAGTAVSAEHLRNMLVACADPVSGEPLGSAPRARGGAAPVAGFDLTFSPSKSVSTAWALADAGTKAVIYECHRRALSYVLAYAERYVFHSRSGRNGIVEEDVSGVVAACFTHWSSRADDPQLHDHLVVWNRARTLSDGRWRTLDSRAVFKAVVTLSELHDGVLGDLLTGALGVGWEPRRRRHSSRPRYEIDGVPEALMAEFSRRADQIAAHSDRLRAEFVTARGRAPSAVEDMRLHQLATVVTRPRKSHRSLAELTESWRSRAAAFIPVDAQVAWVTSLRDRNDLPLLRRDDLGEPILADAARTVVANVAERHATYNRLNLLAEAHRLLHGVRFAAPDDRVAVAEHVADLATEGSLQLTPPVLHHTPARYLRPDGSSRLHPTSRLVYTTRTLLDAEARLLAAARALDGPRVGATILAGIADADLSGRPYGLSADQVLAVEQVVTSGRVLDVLVGPAGTGKSTTMAGLRAAWEAEHGTGSVIGLAPSAAAAEMLSQELGIDTENTAKWLTEHRRVPALVARRVHLEEALERQGAPLAARRADIRSPLGGIDDAIAQRQLRPGQLVIIDEASLAGTFALDEIVTAARDAGAKVLLVGDWAQLSAIQAGGGFSLVVSDRGDLAPELSDVRRFSASWEKVASVELRLGRERALDAYESHHRVVGGDRGVLIEELFSAWKTDIEAGRSSLMIASDQASVAELNRRARIDRVVAGAVADVGLTVADGQVAGVGDEVVTRQNDRLLTTGSRWVRNGDRFVVTATNADGSMAVRRVGGTGEVVLPADYVAAHVELGYATTTYRAQGRTVDTAHALVPPTCTRELLYVAATRGRESNRIYVDTSYDPDPATGHPESVTPQTAREVLSAVLAREGAELSAHETLRRAQLQAESFATLALEYETLAQAAQAARWDAVLDCSGLTADEVESVRTSEAYGPLLAALRDADARGLDVEAAFPRLVAGRSLDDAADVAAVMHSRVDRWIEAAGPRGRRNGDGRIVGLIPRAVGVEDSDMAQALEEREKAMTRRARELVMKAIDQRASWVRTMGPVPSESVLREGWIEAVSTVAAWRDRWGILDRPSHGTERDNNTNVEASLHASRAWAAAEHARRLAVERDGRGFSDDQHVTVLVDHHVGMDQRVGPAV